MWIVYRAGTKEVKGKFPNETAAREYLKRMGGDLKCGCEFCMLCGCGHSADEHIAGDGNCHLCDCVQFKEWNPEIAFQMPNQK